mmetsp:Transcript_27233/g.109045  ORF Transcript_27233/g.109045 Transcript_27233/m.109045 type:complete len:210 (+) Transcript_27233:72-701(+)
MTRPPRGLRQPDTTPWTPPPQALRRRAARAGGVALDSIDARMLATGRVRHVSSGATDRDARAHPPLVTVTIVGLLVQGADVALDKGPAGARHGRQRRAGGRDDDADGDDGDDGGASVALVEVAPGAPELRELPPATLVLDAAPARAPDDDGAFAIPLYVAPDRTSRLTDLRLGRDASSPPRAATRAPAAVRAAWTLAGAATFLTDVYSG